MFSYKKIYINLFIGLSLLQASCIKEGNTYSSNGNFFIAANDASASSYLLNTSSLDSGSVSIVGSGIELLQQYTTWVMHKNTQAFGLKYNQGDPGLGICYRINSTGNLVKSGGEVEIAERFTSYGPFNKYVVSSVGGYLLNSDTVAVFNFFDVENNNANSKFYVKTSNFAGNGQQATFSGIVDLNDGTFLTGVVLSGAKPSTASGGASTGYVAYPDSCWVARFDVNMNLKNIYRDGRISYSSGRFRSQYYSQIAADDDNNTYVFSGAFDANTTKKAGVIRINKGETSFDQSYYFDIQTVADNHKFRRVWHLTGDYFLLEFYNTAGNVTTLAAATSYGIIQASSKSFTWLNAQNGFADPTQITSTGLPVGANGKFYIPITIANSKPAIYVIDPLTKTAKRGLEVDATSISAIGYLDYTSN